MRQSFKGKSMKSTMDLHLYGLKMMVEGESVVNGLNARKVNGGKKYIKLISREERSLFKSSQTGRCSSVIKIADDELIVNKLINYDDLYYMPILKEINNISVYVERHFDASNLYKKSLLVLKGEEETEWMDFSDMPRMVYRLKKYHQAKFDLLTDTFKQLFPNITDIEVQEFDIGQNQRINISNDAPYTISNKVYSIFVKDENLNQPLDFTSMSDGAKRVFLMLTFAVIANIQNLTLLAFEEPENSIHPSFIAGIFTGSYSTCRRVQDYCSQSLTVYY